MDFIHKNLGERACSLHVIIIKLNKGNSYEPFQTNISLFLFFAECSYFAYLPHDSRVELMVQVHEMAEVYFIFSLTGISLLMWLMRWH